MLRNMEIAYMYKKIIKIVLGLLVDFVIIRCIHCICKKSNTCYLFGLVFYFFLYAYHQFGFKTICVY